MGPPGMQHSENRLESVGYNFSNTFITVPVDIAVRGYVDPTVDPTFVSVSRATVKGSLQ